MGEPSDFFPRFFLTLDAPGTWILRDVEPKDFFPRRSKKGAVGGRPLTPEEEAVSREAFKRHIIKLLEDAGKDSEKEYPKTLTVFHAICDAKPDNLRHIHGSALNYALNYACGLPTDKNGIPQDPEDGKPKQYRHIGDLDLKRRGVFLENRILKKQWRSITSRLEGAIDAMQKLYDRTPEYIPAGLDWTVPENIKGVNWMEHYGTNPIEHSADIKAIRRVAAMFRHQAEDTKGLEPEPKKARRKGEPKARTDARDALYKHLWWFILEVDPVAKPIVCHYLAQAVHAWAVHGDKIKPRVWNDRANWGRGFKDELETLRPSYLKAINGKPVKPIFHS